MKVSSTEVALVAFLPLFIGACDETGDTPPPENAVRAPEPTAQVWPAGTVLAVDDVPILVDEVDAASVWIERVDPKSSGPQLRRLALTNVALPRAIAEAMAPEEHARAWREAERAIEEIRAGTYTATRVEPPAGVDGESIEAVEFGEFGEIHDGNWQQLGLAVWGLALDLPPGEWSGPFEDVGAVLLVRPLERRDRPHTAAIELRVEVLVFPYLDEEADVEGAKEQHRLTIVDPAWRVIVPELDQYRMGVHSQ